MHGRAAADARKVRRLRALNDGNIGRKWFKDQEAAWLCLNFTLVPTDDKKLIVVAAEAPSDLMAFSGQNMADAVST